MYKLFLCLRYLRKRRIAFFGVTAVALCVGLLIVVTSLFDGFIHSYVIHMERLLGQIEMRTSESLDDYDALAARLETLEGVSIAKPVVKLGALLYLGRGDVRGVQIWGIDLERQAQEETFHQGMLFQSDRETPSFLLSDEAQAAARNWMETRLQREITDEELPTGAILGIGVLAHPDDETDQYDKESIRNLIQQRDEGMQITTGRLQEDETTAGEVSARKIQRWFWLVDVVETGLHDADTRFVYLPFKYVKDLVGALQNGGETGIQTTMQITATADADVKKVIEQVRREWGNFAVEQLGWPRNYAEAVIRIAQTKEDADVKRYTFEIRKQMMVLQLILGLICLVVALLMFVILLMIVMQKKKEIGIVRSIGSSRWGVAGIYLGFGGSVGVVGSVIGLGLGWWATRNISSIEGVLTKVLGFKIWRSGVYMFSEIPNEVAWESVVWIILAGVISAMLGAVLPAVRAARMQPVDALRYE